MMEDSGESKENDQEIYTIDGIDDKRGFDELLNL